MHEHDAKEFDPAAMLNQKALPDDTLTVILKCGGKLYTTGVNLEDTQEKTAAIVSAIMQRTLDTVDAKGLKAGGSLYGNSSNK